MGGSSAPGAWTRECVRVGVGHMWRRGRGSSVQHTMLQAKRCSCQVVDTHPAIHGISQARVTQLLYEVQLEVL